MGQADNIRQYVLEHLIEPARLERRSELTVRAGDIHKQMRLHQAMPPVCSALGTRKFLDLAAVSLQDRRGPINGSNVYFIYDLNPDPSMICKIWIGMCSPRCMGLLTRKIRSSLTNAH